MLRLIVCLAMVLTGLAPPARALRPGDVVTSFGSQGYVRIPFDRAGESRFDSARHVAVRYETAGLPLAFPYVYAAGIAGDRAAIVKLDGNGQLVAGFGDNGRAISTQPGLGSIAGLGFAPNGDVVIAYSRNNPHDFLFNPAGEDFFVEVFDRNGQPRSQQQVFLFGTWTWVNWVGVNLANYGSGPFCDADDFSLRVEARSMAQSSDGRLAIAGRVDYLANDPAAFADVNATVVARFGFDGAAGVYRRSTEANHWPFGDGGNSCMSQGAFGYYIQDDHAPGPSRTLWPDAATYLTPVDLRLAGPVGTLREPPGQFRRHGAYYAVPDAPQPVHVDVAGSAWLPESGYWGLDTRNTEFHAMHWAPERPNLFVYGTAEDGFFAGGTQLKPIVAFDQGSSILTPRWAFLNADMSALYSSSVEKGFYRDGQHVLLGTLRLCSAINACTGEWDGYFVSRTSGEPSTLAYAGDAGFGEQGSRAYRVPGNTSGVPAERVWAWDGAVLAANTSVPGESPPADLIVVGDFRRAGGSPPEDFDWFVTRIRLRGSAGTLSVTVQGNGQVSGSPAGIACPGNCSQALPADAEVVLTATPQPGFGFMGWAPGSQCLRISGDRCTVHVDGNQQVTALFEAGPSDVIFADDFEVRP